jgi:hypothetical protein
MESILALSISLWLLYRLFKPKPKARQAPKASAKRAPSIQTRIAQAELLESILCHIDGLQDEYNRLDRECQIALATGNTKRLDANAKKIDRLTEQIARKKLQAAQLQDKLTRSL